MILNYYLMKSMKNLKGKNHLDPYIRSFLHSFLFLPSVCLWKTALWSFKCKDKFIFVFLLQRPFTGHLSCRDHNKRKIFVSFLSIAQDVSLLYEDTSQNIFTI